MKILQISTKIKQQKLKIVMVIRIIIELMILLKKSSGHDEIFNLLISLLKNTL